MKLIHRRDCDFPPAGDWCRACGFQLFAFESRRGAGELMRCEDCATADDAEAKADRKAA